GRYPERAIILDMSTKIGRRDILRAAGTTAASVTAASYSRVMGANDRITLGAIGVGDRGRHDMKMFQNTGEVDVRAVCDIYAQQIDLAKQQAPNAESFSDHRKLLEIKEIDAVLIATPDHW